MCVLNVQNNLKSLDVGLGVKFWALKRDRWEGGTSSHVFLSLKSAEAL